MTDAPGVLLVNLGTPSAPTPRAVGAYLREFLMDGRVIDIGTPMRAALVHGVIAPLRSPKSAEAYRAIWTEAGSPLLTHSQALADAVAHARPQYRVQLAMRYGEPSMQAGLAELRRQGCTSIVLAPLYPQFAASTTGSTLERAYALAAKTWNPIDLRTVEPFYDNPDYLDALARSCEAATRRCGHLLLSFHGVPERHLHKSDPTGEHCLREGCCDAIGPHNARCYRAHCFATARGVAERLGLAPDAFTISFQSRLGRARWTEPSTETVLHELAQRGVHNLAVACPAFVVDGLESLEEIGMRGKELFTAAGGQRFELIPCLNQNPDWVEALCGRIDAAAGVTRGD